MNGLRKEEEIDSWMETTLKKQGRQAERGRKTTWKEWEQRVFFFKMNRTWLFLYLRKDVAEIDRKLGEEGRIADVTRSYAGQGLDLAQR